MNDEEPEPDHKPNVAQTTGRIVFYAAVPIVLTLVIAWLVDKAPVLGLSLAVLASLSLAWALWRVIPSSNKLLLAGIIGGTLVVAGLGLFVLTSIFAEDDQPSAALQPVANANSDDSIDSTTTTESVPATTSAPDNVVAITDGDDCQCDDDNELTSLHVVEVGDAAIFEIGTAGNGPTSVWLWSLADPGRPVRIDLAANERKITLPEAAPGPWAVVSQGGDRVPNLGFLHTDGTHSSVADLGEQSARIEADVATVQTVVPTLDATTASLVGSLLARQQLAGTTAYAQTVVAQPNSVATVEIAVEWPLYGQAITEGGEFILSAHVTADQQTICSENETGTLACDPFTFQHAVLTALAIVGNPAQLILEPLPDQSFDGQATTCVRVVASPIGGPPIGTTCWLPDGVVTLLQRDGIDALTLQFRTGEIDRGVLMPGGLS